MNTNCNQHQNNNINCNFSNNVPLSKEGLFIHSVFSGHMVFINLLPVKLPFPEFTDAQPEARDHITSCTHTHTHSLHTQGTCTDVHIGHLNNYKSSNCT